MLRTPVAEALGAASAASEIRIGGWVRTRRDAKGFSFLELNDGSCLGNIQCIVDEGTAAWDKLEGVNTGACVAVTGELVESPGKGQKWEVRAKDMTVFGLADPETFPLQKKRHSDEFLRTIAHLRSRTNKYGAAFRIRAEAAHAVHDFFYQNGFYYVHTPILTGSDCEGAGEMFRVTTLPLNTPVKPGENPYAQDFFGKECSLTVSGQLEAEALALGLGKVYTFGRGEGTFLRKGSLSPPQNPPLSLPRLLAGGEAAWREFVPAEDGDFSVLWEKDVCRGVKMGTAMCSGKRKTLQCPCEPDSEAFFIPKESGGWPLLAKRPRRNPQSPAGVAVMPFTCRT